MDESHSTPLFYFFISSVEKVLHDENSPVSLPRCRSLSTPQFPPQKRAKISTYKNSVQIIEFPNPLTPRPFSRPFSGRTLPFSPLSISCRLLSSPPFRLSFLHLNPPDHLNYPYYSFKGKTYEDERSKSSLVTGDSYSFLFLISTTLFSSFTLHRQKSPSFHLCGLFVSS